MRLRKISISLGNVPCQPSQVLICLMKIDLENEVGGTMSDREIRV